MNTLNTLLHFPSITIFLKCLTTILVKLRNYFFGGGSNYLLPENNNFVFNRCFIDCGSFFSNIRIHQLSRTFNSNSIPHAVGNDL